MQFGLGALLTFRNSVYIINHESVGIHVHNFLGQIFLNFMHSTFRNCTSLTSWGDFYQHRHNRRHHHINHHLFSEKNFFKDFNLCGEWVIVLRRMSNIIAITRREQGNNNNTIGTTAIKHQRNITSYKNCGIDFQGMNTNTKFQWGVLHQFLLPK